MCCLHCSPRQFSSGSYSGFFFLFFFFLRKQIYFGSEGVTRDKLVFGMMKPGHVSFQILTRDFYSLDFGTTSHKHAHNCFFSFFYYYPNFFLGRPFGISTYRVRTSYLPPRFAWSSCMVSSLPQCRVWRYLLLSFVMSW